MRALLASLLLAGLLWGCAAAIPKPGQDQAWQALASRYPLGQGYRLQQRVTLLALGKEYPMLAALAMSPQGRWRMQASSEMGGLLFDMLGDTASAQVLRAPQGMGDKPLLLGLAKDLRALYLGGPRQGLSLELAGDGGFSLEDQAWHYRLEVEDLKLSPGPPPAAAFKPPVAR
jgi:hypothetical protein